ncbi:T9SS sorting signal type C domain-containing protein [Flavobacterium aquicola]|uniref:Uncharacterized protein n=1 Tax=Flavobacterium aquicola TaxID=1682742 RepID=A0A3E0E2N2_9FLAO|nr:T9SS sorting signal type C domain-containing protein [Flavobacterium aquicola]REG91196.1 hypothetical protein C8P67_11792 [Flavobacterium aquicola]
MKTILLFVCGLFLISQVSFSKENNINTVANNAIVKNFELNGMASNNLATLKSFAGEKNRIWLNLTNAGGAFKQTLVGYVTNATNGFDKLYDGISIDSNPYIDFYSINLGKNLTIQGRGLPFVNTDEVPLGYRTTIEGTFQISIDHVDGLFATQDIFLKDLTTGVIHNLKTAPYSFTTAVGRFNDRFVLLYIDNTPVAPIIPDEIASEETDPAAITPEAPAPDVTNPIITVPEVPAPIVTEPVVTVPEVPAPIVTEPVVTVPEVPVPIVTEPVVIVPETPAPIVTVPEVPAPIVTEPIAVIPEVSDSVTDEPVAPSEPVVTAPKDPSPIQTEPVVATPIVTIPEVADQIETNGKSFGNRGKAVVVSVNNNEIMINSEEDAINEVFIYNMGQKQLFGRKNINTNEFVISGLGASRQVLIIKTQLKNGKSATNKIIL